MFLKTGLVSSFSNTLQHNLCNFFLKYDKTKQHLLVFRHVESGVFSTFVTYAEICSVSTFLITLEIVVVSTFLVNVETSVDSTFSFSLKLS